MNQLPSALRVCALVPYPVDTTPSQRFRLEQWRPLLEAEGIQLDLFPFADARLARLLRQPGQWLTKGAGLARAFGRRLAGLRGVRRYDVAVIHRAACIAGPAVIERLIDALGIPILFDFDDAIYRLHTDVANRRFGWLKFPGKTAAICRRSAHVVVGNAHLAKYARQYNPNVTVIPSSVDTDRFRPVCRSPGVGPVVVGWTGSSTSQTYLEAFAPVLRNITALPGIELRVHSDRRPDLPGIPFVWRPWFPSTEAEELAAFDVGLMPMPDDPWARGKCAMKALLYMSMGIPAVCSAVGTNREVIQDGETGLLPQTDAEWVAALRRLVLDADLRHRLGAAARRTVEAEYSAAVCGRRFAAALRRVAGQAVSRGDKRPAVIGAGTTQLMTERNAMQIP
jgi:glycosyltransferase involved in cell wall biosynthesis